MFEADVYLGSLRRSWRLLLVLAIVLAVVAVLLPIKAPVAKIKSNKYHWDAYAVAAAEPVDFIGDSGVTNATIVFFGSRYTTKFEAIRKTGQLANVDVLAPRMSASGVPSAGLTSPSSTAAGKVSKKAAAANMVVKLVAPGTSKAMAVKLANAYVALVGAQIQTAYNNRLKETTASRTGAPLPPTSGFQLLQPALPSTATHVKGTAASFTSSHKARLVIGLVFGLLLGAVLVLIRELRDKSIKTKSRAKSVFGFPVISELRPVGLAKEAPASPRLEVWSDPASANAESYRLLRISVNFEELAEQDPADPFAAAAAAAQLVPKGPYQPPEPGSRKVVMVASTGDEETRAIVSANLAATYSEAGQSVIMIGTGDIESGRGAGNVIDPVTGPSDIEPYLLPTSLDHVSRLSLRPFVAGSGQLVNKAPGVLAAVRQMADVVVIDGGPILALHHVEALAHVVDVTLLVVECRTTRVADGRRAGELIRRIGVPVLGIVLTDAGASRHRPRPPVAGDGGVPVQEVTAFSAPTGEELTGGGVLGDGPTLQPGGAGPAPA